MIGLKQYIIFLKPTWNPSPPWLVLYSTFLCVGYIRHSADKMCTAVLAIKQICLFRSRWDQHHNSKQNLQSITFKGISCLDINVSLSPSVPLSVPSLPHWVLLKILIRGKASGYRGIKKDQGEGEGKRNRKGENKEGEEQRKERGENTFPGFWQLEQLRFFPPPIL